MPFNKMMDVEQKENRNKKKKKDKRIIKRERLTRARMTKTARKKDRKKERERQRKTKNCRETQRQIDRETEGQRERQTDRQTDRKTDRQRKIVRTEGPETIRKVTPDANQLNFPNTECKRGRDKEITQKKITKKVI